MSDKERIKNTLSDLLVVCLLFTAVIGSVLSFIYHFPA